MEREKMIEEIAKKVCIACGICKELKADCYLARNIASVMIDADYCKVPDGAVVLTKEEYEHLKNIEVKCEHSFEWEQGYEDGIKRGRKDTAMAFANALKKVFNEQKSRFDKIIVQEQKTYKYLRDEDDKVHIKQIEDNANGQAVMAEKAIVYIDKLLKENFGVEVEE